MLYPFLLMRGDRVPRGVATAKQLALMARVLDRYCRMFHITNEVERDNAAASILGLFDKGFSEEETLLAELLARRGSM